MSDRRCPGRGILEPRVPVGSEDLPPLGLWITTGATLWIRGGMLVDRWDGEHLADRWGDPAQRELAAPRCAACHSQSRDNAAPQPLRRAHALAGLNTRIEEESMDTEAR